ncbi:MAG: calcium/sodium antiporter [Erysipelotrichaceae bacterium]|nr:calcium/sodium antiporter [Erysipelotrichaceae bacterium]
MEIVFNFSLLIIGFVLLMKGADVFVDGASKIAIKMHVPEIVVGLTIVAMGTSAPEAAISITAALNNGAAISIGNVIGSNIMNIALILGLTSIIATLPIKENTLRIEIPFVVIITVILCMMGYFFHEINRLAALLLIILFIAFLSYLYWLSKKGVDSVEEVEELSEKDTYLRLLALIVIGAVMIVVGSNLTVDAAKAIAKIFGISDRIIGLTIVAFGTSLPELVTSVTAARKGKTDIAIGNIVGSNIFNILFVLGISGLVSPSPIFFDSAFLIDGVIAIVAAVLLFVLSYSKKSLNRIGGIILLAGYIIYIVKMMI